MPFRYATIDFGECVADVVGGIIQPSMPTYCDFAPSHPVHAAYHANEYGFPETREAALFERLVLEINQAGLSWETILKKRDGFRAAYREFDVDAVAAFDDAAVSRLLADPGIIRNRLKVAAAIHNAQVIQTLRTEHGSFAAWLAAHHPREKAEWVKLFKQTFKFTGGEIVGEFLMSIGYLPGAHDETCPVFAEIAALGPVWVATKADVG
jgi:DNA-3-methyladenine glycosylase I